MAIVIILATFDKHRNDSKGKIHSLEWLLIKLEGPADQLILRIPVLAKRSASALSPVFSPGISRCRAVADNTGPAFEASVAVRCRCATGM